MNLFIRTVLTSIVIAILKWWWLPFKATGCCVSHMLDCAPIGDVFLIQLPKRLSLSLFVWGWVIVSLSVDRLTTLSGTRTVKFPVIWVTVNNELGRKGQRSDCVVILCAVLSVYGGRDSVVGMATWYGLDGPGIESPWDEIFRIVVGWPSFPLQTPVLWVPGASRG
jgi:hypothetical protein